MATSGHAQGPGHGCCLPTNSPPLLPSPPPPKTLQLYLQDGLADALLNVGWLVPHRHLGDTWQVYQRHRAAGQGWDSTAHKTKSHDRKHTEGQVPQAKGEVWWREVHVSLIAECGSPRGGGLTVIMIIINTPCRHVHDGMGTTKFTQQAPSLPHLHGHRKKPICLPHEYTQSTPPISTNTAAAACTQPSHSQHVW